MDPLVSVVIPSYNHAHLLHRALQSLIDQTFVDWEAIIVDNYSKDNTDDVIAAFGDARFRLLKINNNGVIAASRNLGIRSASGEWIALLDSDDWWSPEKLQECLRLKNEETSLIFHDLKINGIKNSMFITQVIKGRRLVKPVLIDLLTNGNAIANSSVMIRKNVLHNLNGISEDIAMIACEDYNTWLRTATITDAFLYVPKVLGFYMVHSAGVSQKDMSVPMRAATAEFMERLNKEQKNKAEALIRYQSVRFAFLANRNGNISADLFFVLRYGPFELKAKSFFMLIKLPFK